MTDKNEFKMPFLMNVEKASKIIFRGSKKKKNYPVSPTNCPGNKIVKTPA